MPHDETPDGNILIDDTVTWDGYETTKTDREDDPDFHPTPAQSKTRFSAKAVNTILEALRRISLWFNGSGVAGQVDTPIRLADGIKLADATLVRTGTGDPEGVEVATVSSVWLRTDAPSNNAALYIKTTGVGATGWVAVDPIGTVASSLAATLVAGNVTAGQNIVVTIGDSIESSSGALLLDVLAKGVSMGADLLTAGAVATKGAAVTNGATGAQGMVVGSGVGNDGVTVFTGVANTGRLIFADASGAETGGFRYDHLSQRLELIVEALQVGTLEAGGNLLLNGDVSCVDGTFTGNVDITTGTLDVSGLATFDGNVTLDSANPDLIIDKAAAGNNGDLWWKTGGADRWNWRFDTAGALKIERYNTSAVFQDNPISIAQATGDIIFANDISAVDGTFSGNVDITTGTLDVGGAATFDAAVALDSASADLTIGDGTGSTDLIIQKSDAGSAEFRWNTDSGSGLNAHFIIGMFSSEDLGFFRRNADGTANDTPLLLDWGTGDAIFANDISAVDGTFSGNVGLDSASPMLTVGDGTASPVINLDKGSTSDTAAIEMREAGSLRWLLRMDAGDNLQFARYIGTFQGFSFQINNATGDITLGEDGDVTVTNSLLGAGRAVNAQTGTIYTLLAADKGKVVTLDNGAAITLTVPNSLGIGFWCDVIQKGAGQVTFSATATVNNRQTHTKTAGQHAHTHLVAYVADVFNLSGDTAA